MKEYGKGAQGETAAVSGDNTEVGGLSRRRFVGGAVKLAAAGALTGWLPAFRIGSAEAATCSVPPAFPAGITLYQQAYINWARDIAVDPMWTCAPATPADVVTICNWARVQGYRVRALGSMHNWSPLTVAQGASCPNVILVNTRQNLKAVSVNTATTPRTVTAQTGILMEALLATLESYTLGVNACPAPGDLTLGGALAIDGHGTGVPKSGESLVSGNTWGSLSNLIRSLTAVVWDASSSQYALRTFQRSDPDCAALLTHVGRAFITEVQLQVGANQRLRCRSWFDKTAAELFAPAGSSGNTVNSYLNSAGRFEAIWFPFTPKPWIKVWNVQPSKPWTSKEVTAPYNYPFSDGIDQAIIDAQAQAVLNDPASTPDFGLNQYNVVAAGLVLTGTWDLWGWSKNLMLYIKPTTLRVTANGYAVLLSRANVQRAINEFYVMYSAKLAAYQAAGKYPMNGPVEIRVTGLDRPGDVIGISGATSPQLSALRPRPDHPEWDTAVWFDILTIPGTQHANAFYREVEQWMYSNYASYAAVRVEWSKGWGYSNSAAWADATVIGTTVPNSLRSGQPVGNNYDTARIALNQLDPFRLFSAPLLDALLP
ncbi:FAD-binding protein [Solimonas sp. K1W22B-7]|uniref:cholesterol oxidase substrate-binding domain-containing protein n=1 Tax=Solimonas sp. K1W22B-7 TaxID=2303331 RepID=UPI000E32F4E0|nr:cholesterol oxidase substrate-binding domain-containing protein [Solimonas sp. K1W22B-7]AXQ30922.1 FAD-binding protein [Solimonas sp. K1W22B-7]